ncbi:MAG: RNA 3'-phosphate cyclase, partial [Planctomycetes bacterium]|nr:RNA 3'-phosphate cyclase [Planctomycetota bacterium]
NRSSPGLKRQHLTCVKAAGEICSAEIRDAEIGSRSIYFSPQKIMSGQYSFNVGSAGSAILVLQTVICPILLADAGCRVRVTGGTHNAWAPPWDFLELTFLPTLQRMGASIHGQIHRHGFFPKGGGEVEIFAKPWTDRWPLKMLERSEAPLFKALPLVANLSTDIAKREARVVRRTFPEAKFNADDCKVDALGTGNVVMIHASTGKHTQIFTGFGRQGKKAERVATEAVAEAKRWADAKVPVCEHLADQLLLPMALGAGGVFCTTKPTEHLLTNIDTINLFLDVRFEVKQVDETVWQIEIFA